MRRRRQGAETSWCKICSSRTKIATQLTKRNRYAKSDDRPDEPTSFTSTINPTSPWEEKDRYEIDNTSMATMGKADQCLDSKHYILPPGAKDPTVRRRSFENWRMDHRYETQVSWQCFVLPIWNFQNDLYQQVVWKGLRKTKIRKPWSGWACLDMHTREEIFMRKIFSLMVNLAKERGQETEAGISLFIYVCSKEDTPTDCEKCRLIKICIQAMWTKLKSDRMGQQGVLYPSARISWT